jgi:hypothetical protein
MVSVRRASASLLTCAAALFCAAAVAAPPAEVTRTSRPVRLLRSWEETVKASGGREFARRVDVVFDYSRGYAYQITFNSEGLAVGKEQLGAGHPAPSREEIDEAFALVRNEPSFQRIFQRFNVVLEGGFVLLETPDKRCGPGTRCLRVFLLSSDRAGTIRQAVVDLVKREVVYPDFVPEPWRAPK